LIFFNNKIIDQRNPDRKKVEEEVVQDRVIKKQSKAIKMILTKAVMVFLALQYSVLAAPLNSRVTTLRGGVQLTALKQGVGHVTRQRNLSLHRKFGRMLVTRYSNNVFSMVDTDKNGEVSENELYTAVLLLYLKVHNYPYPTSCIFPTAAEPTFRFRSLR